MRSDVSNHTIHAFTTTHPCQLTIILAQEEALHLSLHKLERMLKEYSPLMSRSIEKSVDMMIKYGAVFAEVSSPNPNGNEQDIDKF